MRQVCYCSNQQAIQLGNTFSLLSVDCAVVSPNYR